MYRRYVLRRIPRFWPGSVPPLAPMVVDRWMLSGSWFCQRVMELSPPAPSIENLLLRGSSVFPLGGCFLSCPCVVSRSVFSLSFLGMDGRPHYFFDFIEELEACL